MKKIALLSGLIFILCSACDNKDSFNKELLIGDWELQQSSVYPVYSPTINFNANGEYKMVELIKYSPITITTIIEIGSITGEYLTYDNKIEFTTATIELETSTTDSSENFITGHPIFTYRWNYDSAQLYSNSTKPVIVSGYKPMIWTVIELTETTLIATKSPGDTLVYLKN